MKTDYAGVEASQVNSFLDTFGFKITKYETTSYNDIIFKGEHKNNKDIHITLKSYGVGFRFDVEVTHKKYGELISFRASEYGASSKITEVDHNNEGGFEKVGLPKQKEEFKKQLLFLINKVRIFTETFYKDDEEVKNEIQKLSTGE